MGVTVTLPFALGADGAIATTTNERRQLLDRVQAVVATMPGDRVMRPTYGVDTAAYLFAASADLAEAEIRQSITAGVARWEPSAVVQRIDFTVNDSLGLVDAQVQVSRADIPGREKANTRIVSIAEGGTVSESPQ
jgi:phage baseplate assembly protein W